MAATNSDGKAPGGHGGKTVAPKVGKGTASADKERAAVLAERNRQATVARGRTAAIKARAKTAARGHIGPLK